MQLGKTTEADVHDLFGDPDTSEAYTDKTGTTKTFDYQHSSSSGFGPFLSMDYDWLRVEIKDARVAGYVFACDRNKNDETWVDPSKFAQITEGRTTRAQAVSLLGLPTAKAVHGTSLPEFNRADTPTVSEFLAWSDAPQARGLFKLDGTDFQLYILQVGADGTVVGKANLTTHITFENSGNGMHVMFAGNVH